MIRRWFLLEHGPVALTVFLAISQTVAQAENWPCFRGPGRQGISADTALPLHWSGSSNILWKTEIAGEAWSSPVVWGDHLFLTTVTEGGVSCHVLEMAASNGQIRWDKEVFTQVPRRKEGRNSYASSTPVTDGKRVYSVFSDGSFAALDFSGRIVWTNRSYPFFSKHGMGTSPLLWDDLLILAHDGSSDGADVQIGWKIPWDQNYVVALDKATGKQRWKARRGMSRIGHAVPAVWKSPEGVPMLISNAGDVVQGINLRTGEAVWKSENIGETPVPSVVLGGDLAFVGSGWGGRETTKAFRITVKGEQKESNLVWEQRKGVPHIPSFLYLKPWLFSVNEGGIAMCLKAETGEIVWQERLPGNYSASPIESQGRIYFTSDEGVTSVVEAGPEFRVLAQNPLGEGVQASLAASNHKLYIRARGHVYCVAERK